MADEYKTAAPAVSPFRDSLVEFSQNTTFHGLRYIGSSHSRIRRLMWLLFVLGCLTAVIIQIVDRVQFFYSWPLNVNVKINYNQTLKFPAVTICNQNTFRATKAAEYGRYDLVEELYSHTNHNITEQLHLEGASNLTREELFRSLAHSKHDLIIRCEWNKHSCSADDFDVIFTDHGVCFIFKQDDEDMYVSASGVDAGLRMTLNVEQYEYMTGPHDAAGVKLLLHEPLEKPFVHELGQAIPTGSHAFVGVKFMRIENLPRPYGECDYKKLSHTDFYTSEECFSDCLLDFAKKRCSCRDMYMPEVNDEPRVCTLDEYYTCLEELKETFKTSLREECVCPVPCTFSLFDPSISYATISNHVVSKLLTNNNTRILKQKLLAASEVTARYDESKFTKFKMLVNRLLEKFLKIKDVIADITESLIEQKNSTQYVFGDILELYKEKERLYRFQIYTVEKNFLRGREAMEERTLRNVPNAYAEFAMTARRRIRRLASMAENATSEREQLYNLILDSLTVRQEIVRMARANITLLIDSFINGTKIFNYKFEDVPRTHNPYIIPKPLLNYSMHHNWYMEKYVPKLRDDDFDLFDYVFEVFKNETRTAYYDFQVNETELNWVYERFQYTCRTFLFSKSVVYSQGIDLPIKVLNERLVDFENIWNNFNSQMTMMNQSLTFLTHSINYIRHSIIPSYEGILSESEAYIRDDKGKLMVLADAFLSNKTLEYEHEIKTFFQELETRGQTIQDTWDMIYKPVYSMWNKILNDEDAIEYYEFTNNTKFLQDINDVMVEWNLNISRLKQEDVRSYIMFADTDFSAAFSDIVGHLEHFKTSIKIDSEFLRQNFLQVDVFFRQLSYEEIHQQKAYDFFALICDIGGAMGLFIGASMLTIVEIVDLLLTQTPIFKHKKKIHKQGY